MKKTYSRIDDSLISFTIDTGKDGSWPSKMREDFIKTKIIENY